MRFEEYSFGSIRINGVTYEHDVVIDRGEVRKRKKKPSKKFRQAYGHTPVSLEEEIPWKCKRLVIGTGTGALPVMDEVKREARRRKSSWSSCRQRMQLRSSSANSSRPTRSYMSPAEPLIDFVLPWSQRRPLEKLTHRLR